MSTISMFRRVFDSSEPHNITIEQALERIRTGKGLSVKETVTEIRETIDKERRDSLKKNLPIACFSGTFSERHASKLIKHSGFIVLDFDDVDSVEDKKKSLSSEKFCYACWVSPSGNGIKMLVRIKDGSKHLEHFQSLQKRFEDVDSSGKDVSRACFESYDPEIYVNPNADVYTGLVETKIEKTQHLVAEVSQDYLNDIVKINKWLANTGNAFITGERNSYIYKLASAACRYGIPQVNAESLICGMYAIGNSSFSENEAKSAIKSAYKSPNNIFGSATFVKETLIEKSTQREVEVPHDESYYDPNVKAKDVIYAEDVKEKMIDIYLNGRQKVKSWDIPLLDKHFKRRKQELTLLTGIGNYGKGIWNKYLMLLRSIRFDEKWGVFAPEDNPAEEFYLELVEMMLGTSINPYNPQRPSITKVEWAYDFIGQHFFFIDPISISPTPDYIKSKFLELIIKYKIDGCVIDPFNQMANDYSKSGGRDDKYLETFLSDILRFAQVNDVYMDVVAHPKQIRKDGAQNYPTPEVFDIAGGAMWNNKCDNIMVYHRPNHQIDPNDTTAEISFKKIKKQKITGVKGSFECNYIPQNHRFLIDGEDVMERYMRERFEVQQPTLPMEVEKSTKIRENNNFLNQTQDEYSEFTQFDTSDDEPAPF